MFRGARGRRSRIAGYYTGIGKPAAYRSPASTTKSCRAIRQFLRCEWDVWQWTGHSGAGARRRALADALARATRSEIAAFALMVDAKDAPATAFYEAPRLYCPTRLTAHCFLP